MSLLRLYDIVRLRLRSLVGKAQVEQELDRELSFHFDQLIQENLANGMRLNDARAAAQRTIGGLAQIQEECRDMRQTNRIETIWSDLRYAVRNLRRTPAFTAVMLLTLSLSIGANSAIFSVIQGVLLRPLPYAQPDRLVRIYFKSDSQPKFPLNPNDFRDFRARNRAFSSMAAMARHDVQLSGAGEPILLCAFQVSAGYFRTFGANLARGRDFSPDDEFSGRGRIAILSDRLWRSKFAADPNILGRTIMVEAQPFTVVGIAPAAFQHPGNNYHAVADGDSVDLWSPFDFGADQQGRGSHFMDAIGRLRPGVSFQQGEADLSVALNQLKIEHPFEKVWQVYTIPLFQETVGRTQHMLLVLLTAVGFLLLIACVNAANLLLARSSARVREIAVRSALGAARGRIVRQLLTESLVISLAGAALGTLLAVGGVRALVACLPAGFPRASQIRLDSGVLAFTLLVGIVTGLIFGLVPALTASRTDLQRSLREGGRGSTGSGRQLQLRNFLVVGETGLACVLLIGAGLVLHSFVNLLGVDPGFRPERVLSASLALPPAQYNTRQLRIGFIETLSAAVEAVPGVVAIGVGSDLPWTGYDENSDGYSIEGRSDEYNSKTTGRYHAASPNYFRALGTPLLRGRFFNAHDTADAPTVIMVNQSMAGRYWPNDDAIGKRITFNSHPTNKDWIQIVGIVKDVKDQPDSTSVRPAFWFPAAQFAPRNMSVVVRSSADPTALARQFREAVRQLDPQLAISDLRFMDQIAGAALSGQRFALFLIGLFAALALALATFGMYGVIAYSVSQRMGEFGLRMALGAQPWDVLRMILSQGLMLSVLGAAVGLLGAAALTRLLGSLLYGVSGTDPLTFIAVAILAIATAALACYIPARRATGADPMLALRSS